MLSLNLPFLSHKMMLEPNIYSIKREIFCAMRGGSTVVCVALFQQKDEMRKTPIIPFFRDQNWLEITSVIFQWGTQDMSFFFRRLLSTRIRIFFLWSGVCLCASFCVFLRAVVQEIRTLEVLTSRKFLKIFML